MMRLYSSGAVRVELAVQVALKWMCMVVGGLVPPQKATSSNLPRASSAGWRLVQMMSAMKPNTFSTPDLPAPFGLTNTVSGPSGTVTSSR